MFEMPQEMGLIAIAVRQTEGKGQSSSVIVLLCLFSETGDSRGQESPLMECADPQGDPTQKSFVFTPPAPAHPAVEWGGGALISRLSLSRIKTFSQMEMFSNDLTSACNGSDIL